MNYLVYRLLHLDSACFVLNQVILKYTVNQEIFVHDNIHVLNVHVNKFSRVLHENILKRKSCQIEITVHVLLIK